ncbi:hypothetical protein NQZ68_031302, partial [Dissostichus eleginoides]
MSDSGSDISTESSDSESSIDSVHFQEEEDFIEEDAGVVNQIMRASPTWWNHTSLSHSIQVAVEIQTGANMGMMILDLAEIRCGNRTQT